MTASWGPSSPKSSLGLPRLKGLSPSWSPSLLASWLENPRSSLVRLLPSDPLKLGYRSLSAHVWDLQCTSSTLTCEIHYASSPSAMTRRSHMRLDWSSSNLICLMNLGVNFLNSIVLPIPTIGVTRRNTWSSTSNTSGLFLYLHRTFACFESPTSGLESPLPFLLSVVRT